MSRDELAEGAVPPEDRRDPEPRGKVAETNEWVRSGAGGGGGPTFTQGGIMPGGTEFESWKRPVKGDPNNKLPATNPIRPIGVPDTSPPKEPSGSAEPTSAETEHKRRG